VSRLLRKSLSLLLLFFLAPLWCQENKLFWDGNDWNRLSRQTAGYPEFAYLVKSSYVNGLLDGRLYDYFKIWPADSTVADSILAGEIIDYLKTSELIRVLDNFYNDPLRNYIPVASAILIVNMQAEGHSMQMIDAYTEKSKEWINRLMLQMQGEDQFLLMKKKQKKLTEKKKE